MHPSAPFLAIPLLLGAAITLALAIYAWGRRQEPGVPAFLFTSIGLGFWSLFYALELMSVEQDTKLFWHKMIYTMVPCVPGPWALFLYQHDKRSARIPRWVVPALLIEPIWFITLTWTNDYHHFIWYGIEIAKGFPDLTIFRALGFWIHTAYSYLFVLAATFFFIRMLVSEPSLPRSQVYLLSFAALSPLLINFVHIIGWNPLDPLDLTPFALATTGAASAWYAFRFDIWELLPAARSAIVESMNDGVIILDVDNSVAEINPSALQLLSLNREQIVGKPISAVLPNWAELRFSQTNIGHNAPPPLPLELELPGPDGVLYIDLVFSKLFSRGNRLTGSLLTLRNITRRKRAENALEQERTLLSQRVAEQTADLRRANAELARAAKMKDEFLANMSHELRTPLSTILGLSEALQEQVYGLLAERQVRALRNIEESGRHLLALINDILDVSKIEAGKLTLEWRAVSIESVCTASLGLTRQIAMKKRIETRYTPDSQVKTVWADERRLKQILVNLLSNAVKFTPEGGKIGLTVKSDAKTEMIRFTVWDSGIGIAPEDLSKLFQPFVQLDSRLARQHEGSGLGLALVYRMTELHGGSVTAESTVGQGSRFTISLPWREPAVSGLLGRSPLDSATLNSLNRVVIVDSSTTTVEQVRRYLLELGVETIVHPRAAGAVDLVRVEQPNLIILDLVLPDRSGWELLADLRNHPETRGVPVLILSVMADSLNSERLPDPSVQRVHFMLKPITREQFGDALLQVLTHQEAKLPLAPLASPPPTTAASQPTPLILVVEDNETNVQTLTDYLAAKTYRVDVARSGAEALHYVRQLRPDIVLMDIQMPGMDGLEATRIIRADASLCELPIIAITALAMPGDREKALAAGANDYMSKPVGLKQLTHLIETYLHA
jgi:PAS domain S-box-containing protein